MLSRNTERILRRLLVLVSSLLFLSACSDTQHPAQFNVVSQSPALEAKAVPTNAAISITFSEAVDPASVNNFNFRLLHQNKSVSGTLQTNGNTVIFTPSKPLFFNSKYTITVSADIYGASGRLMPQPYQWDFTTRDGLWNILTTIPQGSEPNTSRAAIDDNGRVMLSWSTVSGTYSSFLDSGAWTTPVLLGQGGYVDSVVSVNNNYAVFWQVRSGSRIQLYCARYIDGAWQPTEALASVDATAMYVSPTMFSDNSLIMIYWFNGGTDGSHAYSRRFINDQGWQADVVLTDQTAWYIIGFHRSGKAVITWKSQVGDQNMAYAQNYDVNSGWSTPVAIGQYEYLTAHSATVNSSGQSMVAFSTAIDMRIASNTQNSGWTQLQPVYQKQAGSFLYSPPQIAMDYLGNVMLVDTEHSPSSNRYFAIRYDSKNGWQQPIDISGGRIPDIMQFSNTLKVDESGNYLLVWQGYDTLPFGIEHTYSSRFQRDGLGWEPPIYLGRQNADTLFAKIAMNHSGGAVAVWQDFYPPNPADFTMSLGVGVFH